MQQSEWSDELDNVRYPSCPNRWPCLGVATDEAFELVSFRENAEYLTAVVQSAIMRQAYLQNWNLNEVTVFAYGDGTPILPWQVTPDGRVRDANSLDNFNGLGDGPPAQAFDARGLAGDLRRLLEAWRALPAPQRTSICEMVERSAARRRA